MIFIVDSKMPASAKKKLCSFGDLLELQTSGLTYTAISGHPDIFFCPTSKGLVVSPQLPGKIYDALSAANVPYFAGAFPPGDKYPQSAVFNALATGKYLIHNLDVTDATIAAMCSGLQHIHVKQAYVRCNLLALGDVFITSDAGIQRGLLEHGFEVHYFSPAEVRLDGFPHGFLGGVCGIWDDKIAVCGSLKYFSEASNLKKLVRQAGFKLFELYDGPLVDVGSIIPLFYPERLFPG